MRRRPTAWKKPRAAGGMLACQLPGGISGLLPEQSMELLATILELFVSTDLCQHPLAPCLFAVFKGTDTSPKLCGVVTVIAR